MKQKIRPDTLRMLRNRKNLSQEALAKRSEKMRQKVGIATIKRIEARTETEFYMAREEVANRLAKTLGVEVGELAKKLTVNELDRAKKLRKLGMRQLRVTVDENVSLAFRMVEQLYGIPIRAQIEMAPLFTALLAEGSLAWRRKRLAEIRQKAEELSALGGGNFSFAWTAERALEAAHGEEDSIRKRDVFGRDVDEDTYDLGYDPYQNNPFVDYLKELKRELGDADMTIDPDAIGIGPSGFPDYRIGAKMLEELTGDDPDAKYALACGHVRLGDIPEELMGEEKTRQRVEWLKSRIPEEELADLRARRAELDELFPNIDLTNLMADANKSEGSQDDT